MAVVLFPAVAASKAPGEAHIGVPSCADISRTKLAMLAQTGPLTLRRRIGNLCEFTGHRPGHYEPLFDIEIIRASRKIWNTAKSDAEKAAAEDGSDFGQVNPKLFFVTGTYTDKGDPPCTKKDGSPGKGPSKFGPVCTPEPNAVHIETWANAIDSRTRNRRRGRRHRHLRLMVAAAVSGQEGDVHLSHMLNLATFVASGKIH